jgi:hypothetical protein
MFSLFPQATFGILDFGNAGVGVFLLELNLTSHLLAIYHPQRWGEAKLAPERPFSQRSRKENYHH